ncbi:hypothetical protein [Methanolapillus africanus]
MVFSAVGWFVLAYFLIIFVIIVGAVLLLIKVYNDRVKDKEEEKYKDIKK